MVARWHGLLSDILSRGGRWLNLVIYFSSCWALCVGEFLSFLR